MFKAIVMSASFVAVGNNVPGVISWNMSLFLLFFFFSVFSFCDKDRERKKRSRETQKE